MLTEPSPLTIANVGYRSTNYWVIGNGSARLLFDLGWPGTLGILLANLRRMDIPLRDIRMGVASHYHMDHAGLAQELREAGMRLLVLETQPEAIPEMKRFMKPRDHYVEIVAGDILPVRFGETRALLAELGIGGEILATPGHSEDSVSLLLDDGSAFTGDLPPEELAETGAEPAKVGSSWRLLRRHGARTVYPAHGPVRMLCR
jgi:ribonuclease/clavin/mitogillin